METDRMQALIITVVTSAVATKYATIAFSTMIVYEYFITLDDEVRSFWRTPFSISHILFFLNRYFPICITVFTVIFSVLVENPSDSFCNVAVRILFIPNTLSITTIQVILVTRIWFLFPGQTFIRIGLIYSLVLTAATSFLFTYLVTAEIKIIPLRISKLAFGSHDMAVFGCHAIRPEMFWRVYLPSFILHSGLYILTAHQALTNPQCAKTVGLRRRLLMDGGIFYLVVLCSVIITTVGSFLTTLPEINVVSVFTPIILTTNSIAASRIMINLRSEISSMEEDLGWENTTQGPAVPLFIDDKSLDERSCRKWTFWPKRTRSDIAFPTSTTDDLSKSSDLSPNVAVLVYESVDVSTAHNSDFWSPRTLRNKHESFQGRKHAEGTKFHNKDGGGKGFQGHDLQHAERGGRGYLTDHNQDEEKGLSRAYMRVMSTGKGIF